MWPVEPFYYLNHDNPQPNNSVFDALLFVADTDWIIFLEHQLPTHC